MLPNFTEGQEKTVRNVGNVTPPLSCSNQGGWRRIRSSRSGRGEGLLNSQLCIRFQSFHVHAHITTPEISVFPPHSPTRVLNSKHTCNTTNTSPDVGINSSLTYNSTTLVLTSVSTPNLTNSSINTSLTKFGVTPVLTAGGIRSQYLLLSVLTNRR